MAGPVGNLISNCYSAPKRSVGLRGGHGCGPGGWLLPEPSSLGTVPQTVSARLQSLLLADCHILAWEVLTQSTEPFASKGQLPLKSLPRLMTQPVHTCPGRGAALPVEGEARPGPFGPRAPASPDPGPESPWATEPGVARWVAPRHTKLPAAMLTIVYLPSQVQPPSFPTLFLCPRGQMLTGFLASGFQLGSASGRCQ